MAKNITQLTQQTGSADPTSLLYTVTGTAGNFSDRSLPLAVLFNSPSFTGTVTIPYTLSQIGAVARTVASRLSDFVSLKDFGAKGDGVTDDTAAIQAWLSALSPTVAGFAPSGNYIFKSTLTKTGTGISICGAGPHQTVFTYAGASTTSDVFHFGNGTQLQESWYLANFRVTSTTTMTSGAALHMQMLSCSQLENVIVEGLDSPTRKLWNGYWFDGAHVVMMRGFDAYTQHDGIIVNSDAGNLANTNLYLLQGYSDFNSNSGIHLAGGFGGLFVDQVECLANGQYNYLQDNSINSAANREILFSLTSILDGTHTTPYCAYINETGSLSEVFINAFAGSSATATIYIKSLPNGLVAVNSNRIFNSLGDAFKVDDNTATLVIGGGTTVDSNTGYAINATVATNNIYFGGRAVNNTAGNFTLNARVAGSVGGVNFSKDVTGKIKFWGTISFTGAANTGIFNTITFPFAFPTSGDTASTKVSILGFANSGVMMVEGSLISNSQLQVGAYSSVTLTNAQTVNWEATGT